MKLNHLKVLTILMFVTGVAVLLLFCEKTTMSSSAAIDAAAAYKAQCAMCHSPKAEKFYDPAKTDEEHVNAILKGKKGEKPPFMPGFEAKGMKPEDAKALAEFMRSLRPAA